VRPASRRQCLAAINSTANTPYSHGRCGVFCLRVLGLRAGVLRAGVLRAHAAVRPAAAAAEPAVGALLRLQLPLLQGLVLVAAAWLRAAAKQQAAQHHSLCMGISRERWHDPSQAAGSCKRIEASAGFQLPHWGPWPGTRELGHIQHACCMWGSMLHGHFRQTTKALPTRVEPGEPHKL
jgi:hypothetical protein